MWNAALSLGARFVPNRRAAESNAALRPEVAAESTGRSATSVQAIFAESEHKSHVEVDRLFSVLMLLQWITAIVIAFVVSPQTWIGDEARIHFHIWTAVLLGGALSGLPILFAQILPGSAVTRQS